MSPVTAWLIADILSDDAARGLSFGTGSDLVLDFRAAAKTGTSPDHRDNWVAGFTARYTVVVWVGNADGRPLLGTSGVEGAGPIFHAVFSVLDGPWLARPEGIEEAEVCTETGLRPGPDCGRRLREFFPAGRSPRTDCAEAAATFRLETPQPWDRFYIDTEAPSASAFLLFRAEAPPGSLVEWRMDGSPLATTAGLHEVSWPALRGVHELRVLSGGVELRRRVDVR